MWNRFLRDKENTTPIFNIPLEILIISNCCFISILYQNTKILFKLKKQSLFTQIIFQSKIITRITELLREYIINAPEFLYTQLTSNKDLKSLLEKPASYFTAYFYYPKTIVIFFLELPLIIISTCFLMDVIFFHNMHHFFISLSFLIPMLFMQLWLFVLEHYSKRRLHHLSSFLNVFYIINENRYQLSLKPDNHLPISYEFPLEKIKVQFPVLCSFWEIYSKIYSFMKYINSCRKNYNPYIQVYTSLCYLLGWSYILVGNLSLITTIPEIFLWKDNVEPFSQLLLTNDVMT